MRTIDEDIELSIRQAKALNFALDAVFGPKKEAKTNETQGSSDKEGH